MTKKEKFISKRIESFLKQDNDLKTTQQLLFEYLQYEVENTAIGFANYCIGSRLDNTDRAWVSFKKLTK